MLYRLHIMHALTQLIPHTLQLIHPPTKRLLQQIPQILQSLHITLPNTRSHSPHLLPIPPSVLLPSSSSKSSTPASTHTPIPPTTPSPTSQKPRYRIPRSWLIRNELGIELRLPIVIFDAPEYNVEGLRGGEAAAVYGLGLSWGESLIRF
jgi:hypothetical protein